MWQSFPGKVKGALVDNLTFLLTMNMPLVSHKNSLSYDTSVPLFKSVLEKIVSGGIPGALEDCEYTTEETMQRFENIKFKFKNSQIKIPCYRGDTLDRAVVSFSSGKDSLLSSALAKEMGLNPVLIYVNDTLTPNENRTKQQFIKKLSLEQKLDHVIVKNELEKLNDFETWNKPQSCLSYTHLLTSFCFVSLPISHAFQARYILLGNERNMDYKFKNKDGFETTPSHDQTKEIMKEQNFMINTMTGKKMHVVSLIKPLTTLAIQKILMNRYPDFAKYTMSCCGLDAAPKESRWCHNCSTCFNVYLYALAFGKNPKDYGFTTNMMSKGMIELSSVFNGDKLDNYDKSSHARDEQLLAFYLAYKNGAKGYLMDLFKKQHLKEAKQREDELIKHNLSIQDRSSVPKELQRKLFSIFNEELN
ncbi:MAG: hypothetical protein GOV02_03305 [Candidatus Aenigmarchaeota archaeon]|nr:hypothetical protein [Candidatus Aenigmarchaeota archaeon]